MKTAKQLDAEIAAALADRGDERYITTSTASADELYEIADDAIQNGNMDEAERLALEIKTKYPDEFSWNDFWGDKMPAKKLTRTYPQARKEILSDLRASGWKTEPGLKIPHATAPDGRLRLWFKSQAVLYSMGSPNRLQQAGMSFSYDLARSIAHDLDIRRFNGPRFQQYIKHVLRGWSGVR